MQYFQSTLYMQVNIILQRVLPRTLTLQRDKFVTMMMTDARGEDERASFYMDHANTDAAGIVLIVELPIHSGTTSQWKMALPSVAVRKHVVSRVNTFITEPAIICSQKSTPI